MIIPVAHDFICPWCWIGFLQAERLRREFGVEIEWLGYELMPDELAWEDGSPASPPPANKPPLLSRFEFLTIADQTPLPKVDRPKRMRTGQAHQAVEYAKTLGVQDSVIERLYRGYWERGLEINAVAVLQDLLGDLIPHLDDFSDAVRSRRFANKVVPFDDQAYASGVYNVPTFYIGGERYAEQPYANLQAAMAKLFTGSRVYPTLTFPAAPENRPYVYIDMIATIDGKILSGERDESVYDLGSAVDHQVMKQLEASADAVLVGAQTLRAATAKWNPAAKTRVVVSSSGNLPFDSAFFTHGEPIIAAPNSSFFDGHGYTVLRAGTDRVDLPELLALLLARGVQRLLVLGGSELNAAILRADLVDELFLTVAPKIRLGRDVPTFADGEALPRVDIQNYDLIGNQAVGDEVFLRYRRKAKIG